MDKKQELLKKLAFSLKFGPKKILGTKPPKLLRKPPKLLGKAAKIGGKALGPVANAAYIGASFLTPLKMSKPFKR